VHISNESFFGDQILKDTLARHQWVGRTFNTSFNTQSTAWVSRHSFKTALMAVNMGISFDLPEKQLQKLASAAVLHDVGKSKIPLNILNKSGKLNLGEWATMMTHPVISQRIILVESQKLYSLNEEAFATEVALIAGYHHSFQDKPYPVDLAPIESLS